MDLTAHEIELCNSIEFDIADAKFLKSLTKHPVELLKFEPAAPEREKPQGICSFALDDLSREIVFSNYDAFHLMDKIIFICDVSFEGDKVGIIRNTSDPYKVLRLAGTNGVNYGIGNEGVINKIKEWDGRFGVRVIGIGFDWCEVELINKNVDYLELAMEVYQFCPDVVDQGTGSEENLAEEMKNSGTIYLWWD